MMSFQRLLPTSKTVRALIKLKVGAHQGGLVADNAVTMAQAAYTDGSYVWGLWDTDTPVGLMAMIHPTESPDHEEGDDPNAAYVWRLMIDHAEQGKGYGKLAMSQAASQAQEWGFKRITLSVVDAPNSNIAFYEKQGFTRTGRIIDGEIELARDI
jgi:diamine N-acetyltransferase